MEATPTENVQITIGIRDVKLLHYEATTRVFDLLEPLPNEKYEFQFDFKVRLSEHEMLFEVLLGVTLFEKQPENVKIELAKISTVTSFKVDNYNEVIRKNGEVVNIPNQLITVAGGIAVSTVRGMFAICVKDTILANAVIPIINPQVFVPKTM
ncbi:MAG: hypothetical protein NTU44_04695 [Bacteroidetes bacterium]|nr:hypothetical protein [Bacteroidota bacterium]